MVPVCLSLVVPVDLLESKLQVLLEVCQLILLTVEVLKLIFEEWHLLLLKQ